MLAHQVESDRIRQFLLEFSPSPDKLFGGQAYTEQIVRIAHREQDEITFFLEHLAEFDAVFANHIVTNTKHYIRLFNNVIQELLPRYRFSNVQTKDLLDVFIQHRALATQTNNNDNNDNDNIDQNANLAQIPLDLERRFETRFAYYKDAEYVPIRRILSGQIGQLVSFVGTVIRCSDVKPLMSVATYVCDKCGAETYQPISQSFSASFIPLEKCQSNNCTVNKLDGRLVLQTRGSKFYRVQELRVQECESSIPVGSVPRSITVFATEQLTRIAQPGSKVAVTGVFLPVPKYGGNFKQLIQGLICDVFVEAQHIHLLMSNEQIMNMQNDAESDVDVNSSVDELARLAEKDPAELTNILTSSIAPEIYGHQDIKTSLLLQCISGSDYRSGPMKIRGNINILLMGDPGVAKSQLLTFINRLIDRSQLTTGKGSSGVGLTAAVIKDPVTGDFALEGGALVLSDGGICCIDEFDKMDENDRTAIHEVMEQQTVSIAKAGISACLNARAAVLAAANPIYGRYNIKKTVEQNVGLPAALLSRFDLIYLIRDNVNRDRDLQLARHVTNIHTDENVSSVKDTKVGDGNKTNFVSMKTLRAYIERCKTIESVAIPKELNSYLTAAYIEMRNQARELHNDNLFISARTLLSLIRLCTALAKLRLSNQVNKNDISEAIRLMVTSKSSISVSHEQDSNKTRKQRPQDVIYGMIKIMAAKTLDGMVNLSEAKEIVLSHGFTLDQFEECVQDYQDLNIWLIDSSMTRLKLV